MNKHRSTPTTRGPRHKRPTTPRWRRILGSRQAPKGRDLPTVAPQPTESTIDHWQRMDTRQHG